MGRNWKQWHVPARNAGADGLAERYESVRMGLEPGTTDDDQVCLTYFPGTFTRIILIEN